MAEDSDLERTEPASPRRIEQAREKGQVARTRELTTVSILLAAGGGLIFMGGGMMEHMRALMRPAGRPGARFFLQSGGQTVSILSGSSEGWWV